MVFGTSHICLLIYESIYMCYVSIVTFVDYGTQVTKSGLG